jgi:hypothetical protein
MVRRDVIKSLGLISMNALYPSVLASFISACRSEKGPEKPLSFFAPDEQGFLIEAIDIIIPKTITKSASETGVHFFLDDIFSTCLNQDQKTLIKAGVEKINKDWNSISDKKSFLTNLDSDAFKGDENSAWFKVFKQYTMVGFFTSEEGTTKSLDYQKIPDRYVGEVEINDHTLAHSNTSLRFYL